MVLARILVGLLVLSLGASCRRDESVVHVDLARRLPEPASHDKGALRFAIGAMVSPREMAEGRVRLATWLGARLGHPVVIAQRATYGETNDLLSRGDVDFALICSGAYVAVPRGDIDLLVASVTKGSSTYQSFVLVRDDDVATSFDDLKGRRFAFVDALSLTGKIYPESLARARVGAEAFFGETVYSHSHTESIRMVARGRVEAAAIDSLVFDQLLRDEPDLVRKLRVLHRSPPFTSPPVVARRALPDDVRAKLRDALLHMHEDVEGRALLADLGFERFGLVDDAAYDSVRALRASARAEVGP